MGIRESEECTTGKGLPYRVVTVESDDFFGDTPGDSPVDRYFRVVRNLLEKKENIPLVVDLSEVGRTDSAGLSALSLTREEARVCDENSRRPVCFILPKHIYEKLRGEGWNFRLLCFDDLYQFENDYEKCNEP